MTARWYVKASPWLRPSPRMTIGRQGLHKGNFRAGVASLQANEQLFALRPRRGGGRARNLPAGIGAVPEERESGWAKSKRALLKILGK